MLGVDSPTCTRRVGTLLHALSNPSDASCSSSVDVYQRFSPFSHAWFKATAKASRHRPPPETNRRGGPKHNAEETTEEFGLGIALGLGDVS